MMHNLLAKAARAEITSAAFIAALLFLVTMSPLLSAWFIDDDWHYLALFRHIDSPLAIFTTNIAATYFYRPIALFFSWASFATFELSATAHYSIHLALHTWVGFEIFRLIRVAAKRELIALFAAAIFLMFPISAGTPVWFSNRFDLLATLASLAAIRNLYAWSVSNTLRPGRLLGVCSWLIVAIGSKETGYAAAAACCLFLVFNKKKTFKENVPPTVAIFIIVLLSVLARLAAAHGVVPDEVKHISLSVYVNGIYLQLSGFATALSQHRIGSASLVLVLAMYAFFHFKKQNKNDAKDVLRHPTQWALLALSVGVLSILVFALQGPIAKLAFPDPTQVVLVSYRLYYTPLAALTAIAGIVFAHTYSNVAAEWQKLAIFSTVSALLAMGYDTFQQNAKWRDETLFRQALTLQAVGAIKAARQNTAVNSLCRFSLTPELNAAFAGDIFFDLALKAHLHKNDPAANCITLATPPIGMILTRFSPCAKSMVFPLQSTPPQLPAIGRSGTCTFYFLQESQKL